MPPAIAENLVLFYPDQEIAVPRPSPQQWPSVRDKLLDTLRCGITHLIELEKGAISTAGLKGYIFEPSLMVHEIQAVQQELLDKLQQRLDEINQAVQEGEEWKEGYEPEENEDPEDE